MIGHPLLDQAARHGVRLGLDRIRAFLDVLGEPHLAAPAIHVAGTNGKGSVCTFVTTALVAAGYRVGTTLSPHLEHVNERIRIDGVPVPDAELTDLLEHIDRVRVAWSRDAGTDPGVLTYFELTLTAAFLAFARHEVDVMVVEVGLGGRLDATRVVRPVCSAVTHVGLDHMEILGPDVATIAAEKAGILVRGVPVCVGPQPPAARGVVDAVARRLGCPLWGPPALRRSTHPDGRVTLVTPTGGIGPLALGLRGQHQGANAMVALGILHRLREQGFHVPDEAIVAGLQDAFLPGRLETPRGGLLLDGAHNPDGAIALATHLADGPRPTAGAGRILLLGMGQNRDPRAFVAPLLDHVDEIVTTRCAHPKAWDPVALALAIEGLHPAISAGGDIEVTLPEVFPEAAQTVVTGSLFVVGAARSLARDGVLDGLSPGQGVRGALEELDGPGPGPRVRRP